MNKKVQLILNSVLTLIAALGLSRANECEIDKFKGKFIMKLIKVIGTYCQLVLYNSRSNFSKCIKIF